MIEYKIHCETREISVAVIEKAHKLGYHSNFNKEFVDRHFQDREGFQIYLKDSNNLGWTAEKRWFDNYKGSVGRPTIEIKSSEFLKFGTSGKSEDSEVGFDFNVDDEMPKLNQCNNF